MDPDDTGTGFARTSIELDAGKGTSIRLTLPDGVMLDSLILENGVPGGAILDFHTAGGGGVVTCFMAPDCGSTAADRVFQLEGSGNLSPELGTTADASGEWRVEFLRYAAGDSTAFERVWPRGSRELLVLQVRIAGTPETRTLRKLELLFASAETVPWEGMRRVYLSDRSRDEIESDLESVDVTPPPSVTHNLHLEVIPANHYLSVSDAISVDFNLTQSDSQLVFILPPNTDTGTAGILSLEGSALREGDSVLCIADPLTRRFSGTFRIQYYEFHLTSGGDPERTFGQVRLSSSFCGETWFYPGSHLPSMYNISITVPAGFEVYMPLNETGRFVRDSIVSVDYASPEGGIMGPISWAVSGSFSDTLLAGRSRFLYQPDEDQIPEELSAAILWAETLAAVLWDNIGFDGAGLDFVMVSSLDARVLLEGPGCIFASPAVIADLAHHDTWLDELLTGNPAPGTAVVSKSASSMMKLSTHLPAELRGMIAAWTVYLFCRSTADDTALEGALMLEAFRKYYLYQTELAGGTEYSLADPSLLTSELAAPVLYGKAPCVLAYFSDVLPRFEPALIRALGSQRHPGNPWSRLFSGLRLSESSANANLFWDWLLSPGFPQLHVTWTQSGDTLFLLVEQFQPGLGFPLNLDEVRMTRIDGSRTTEPLEEDGARLNGYIAMVPSPADTVVSVDLNPSGLVPADIMYERI